MTDKPSRAADYHPQRRSVLKIAGESDHHERQRIIHHYLHRMNKHRIDYHQYQTKDETGEHTRFPAMSEGEKVDGEHFEGKFASHGQSGETD